MTEKTLAEDGLYHGLDEFFDACRVEMHRHLKDKGESWREETQVAIIRGPFGDDIRKTVPTIALLEELLQSALNELFENPTQDQRIDVANIIGMIWWTVEGE